MQVDQFARAFLGQADERHVAAEAGAVDEQVDRPGPQAGGDRRQGGAVGQVGCHHLDRRARFLLEPPGQLLQPLAPARHHYQVVPLASETLRVGLADARRGARHQPTELHHSLLKQGRSGDSETAA